MGEEKQQEQAQEQTTPKKEKQEDENEFTNYYEGERRLLRKALREKNWLFLWGQVRPKNREFLCGMKR